MNCYLVIYEDDCYTYIEADDVKDCIFQFADYTGDNTDLFSKAMQGCISVEDYIDMYEHFGENTINYIYEIKKTIYDKKGEVDNGK